MRERALVHVAGPVGVGKTTFVERLLDAEVALAICVRASRSPKLRAEQESSPKSHAELRRYREAGASGVVLYRFAEPNMDAFFTAAFMQDYSTAVFIEGDCPIDYVDLSVFVAPVPAKGHALLRRVERDPTASHRASIQQLAEALESREALARLLGDEFGDPLVAMARMQPRVLDDLRRSLGGKLGARRVVQPPAPTEHWALEEGYEGIERAQLVVVNVRDEGERLAAQTLLDELGRLRKDDAVFREVVGRRGNKLPISAVIADLSDPKDAGLKKAVARVKRATKRRQRCHARATGA